MSRLGRRSDIPRHRNHRRQRRQYRQLAGNHRPCCLDARFTGVGKSLVGFVDDDDTRVFVGISGDDFRRVVGTAVVDDDYLEFDAIELLYRKAKEEDADMVVFPFSLDYIESGKSECSIEIADEHFTNTEFFSAIAFSKAHWGVWSFPV